MIEIKDPYGFIYITTNMINGKKYIGQKKFMKNWEYYLGSGKYFLRAVRKYGRDNFTRDIVDIGYTKEELDNLEIKWINNYNAVESNDFYNISIGGHNSPFYGKTKEETSGIRHKMSESRKMYLMTDGAIEKLIDYWKNDKNKAEHSEKLRKGCIGRPQNITQKIICVMTNKIFNSISEASDYTGIKTNRIYNHYKAKKKTMIDGHIFIPYKDYMSLSEYELKQMIIFAIEHKKMIICKTTGKIFNSITEASKYYNLDYTIVQRCCNHICNSMLKSELIFRYCRYEDYINQNQQLIHNENLGQAI